MNLRLGARSLLKQPTFTAAVLLTLALGIGGTTAMFSVVYGVLLRPLPFGDPDRIVRLWTAWKPSLARTAVSSANVRDWRAQNRVFEDLALIRNGNYSLTGYGEPERLQAARVWASFFPVLRVTPFLGRAFTEAEEQFGHENVVVLSHALWVRRFGAEPSIVGRTIPLNGVPTTVIGVMKPDFQFPSRDYELWVPLTIPADEYQYRTAGSYSAIARLKPGVTIEQARSDLHVVSANLARQHSANAALEVGMAPLLDDMVGGTRRPLLILLGAVGVLLLIGCANIANLLLARGVARRRELAVRTALGASRKRLIEQSVTELAPLFALGAVLGLLTAAVFIRAVMPLLPADLPRVEGIGINMPVLAFTTAIVIVVAVLVTMWPAIVAARRGITATIAELSRGSTAAPRHVRAGDVLVVGQIATTLLLLVGAIVLVRSLRVVRRVDAGFNADHVLSVHLAVPRTKYPLESDVATLYTRVLDRVQTLPGVRAVGMVNRLPLGGGNQTAGVQIDGVTGDDAPSVQTRTVTPDYFRALEIPIKEGRSFTAADRADAPLVVVIDERLARAVWPRTSPIGNRLRETAGDERWGTIVGVVGHIRHTTLEEESSPQVYWNYTQRGQDRMAMVVKTSGDPAALTRSVGTAVRSADPDQPIYDVRRLDEVIDRSLGHRWLQTVLLGVFAGVALVLASIGAYGVIAYGVGQRLREYGVRMALGARRQDVVAMVVRRGGTLFVLGALAGLALAGLSVRVLSTLVYGVGPRDALSFVLATVVLFVMSMVACYVPARRAARVEPSVALRSE